MAISLETKNKYIKSIWYVFCYSNERKKSFNIKSNQNFTVYGQENKMFAIWWLQQFHSPEVIVCGRVAFAGSLWRYKSRCRCFTGLCCMEFSYCYKSIKKSRSLQFWDTFLRFVLLLSYFWIIYTRFLLLEHRNFGWGWMFLFFHSFSASDMLFLLMFLIRFHTI